MKQVSRLILSLNRGYDRNVMVFILYLIGCYVDIEGFEIHSALAVKHSICEIGAPMELYPLYSK